MGPPRTLLVIALIVGMAVVGTPAAHAGTVDRDLMVGCRGSEPTCWPTAFTFTPNGKRIYFVERYTGQIRVFNRDTGHQHEWKTMSNVADSGEVGMLGIALDPRWPDVRWVYLFYTQDSPFRNRIVRIRKTAGGFTTDQLTTISAGGNHNGGVIHFGPDGKLYAIVGENGDPSKAQNTDLKAGKLLRMTRSGHAPSGNPFGNLVYSYGHRNSFGFTFDPQTDDPWETENGPECDDEINRPVSGGNFGWGSGSSCVGGNTTQQGSAPIEDEWRYTSTIAPTGAAFCQGCGLTGFDGTLFIGVWKDGTIRALTLDGGRDDVMSETTLFDNPNDGVMAVEAAPSGTVFFSEPNGIYRLVGP